ncbi:transglutaminaseTgpA domain-containing protein [Haloterrigena salinisoli]|uniref:transglutaminaseTgpA domain-containing protein n=1 Tax=Haloterrigena salinisoli TaxID=3132747 RepID=UPI0030CC4530
MSTKSNSQTDERTIEITPDGSIGPGTFRLLALCCVLLLTASYVSVLRDVTRVVGGTETLLALVGAMLVAATVLAWAIRPRTATVIALAAAALGFAYYLESSGLGVGVLLSASDVLLSDAVALATGLPLLRMVDAGVWTLAFVPAPVFLSWYLAVRGRYALGVVPGGIALLFLVLTGDAGTVLTLVGTLAAVSAVGCGELERRGGSIAQTDLLAALFALIIVLSLTVTVVPGGSGTPGRFAGTEAGTLEGTIDHASDRSMIGGSVDLSPEVRFTVEAEQASYWRTGVYDRFTGDEWVRTGDRDGYSGPIASPPGESERVEQLVTAETTLGVMPAAPQPVTVDGDLTQHTEVSTHGQIHPSDPIVEGDTYAVESAVIDPDADELRTAGTNYPDPITDRYLQTPEGVSSEFEARTAEITADADTPYEKAAAIEDYLRSTKGYSLEVDRPNGNVAEAFLLEMDEGYCVYFATTMAQMLRAEDVPVRYVTGYTSGQQVDDDEYVVRGTDAHAWVEVYFPDHGWVAFDPTPSGPRDAAHDERVEQAREDGSEDVDTDSSDDVPLSDEEARNEPGEEPTNIVDGNESEDWNDSEPDTGDGPDNDTRENDTSPEPGPAEPDADNGSATDGEDGDGWLAALVERVSISREAATVALVALTGLVAGVHRTGAVARLRRTVGLYWQRRSDDPDRDAERAYRRLERLLDAAYRPRERSESARGYLEALAEEADEGVDTRTKTVVERYERAVYGGGVDREGADEAMAIVDELARERLPGGGQREN